MTPNDTAQPSEASVTAAVAKVGRVPDTYREFRVGPRQAQLAHKVGPALRVRLLDAGLPHRRIDDELRMDALDLQNIGIDLRLPCLRWTGMRAWSRMLAEVDRCGKTVVSVQFSARCPQPGHRDACRFAFDERHVETAVPGSFERLGPGTVALDIRLTSVSTRFGETLAPIVRAASKLSFHLLPQPLAKDLGFVRDTQLADCRLAAIWLAQVAAEQGVSIRRAGGVFVSRPFPVRHAWLELGTDAGWRAVDPFLLLTLHRWGISSAAVWPPDRCVDGLFWTMPHANAPLFTHRGAPTYTSMVIRADRALHA